MHKCSVTYEKAFPIHIFQKQLTAIRMYALLSVSGLLNNSGYTVLPFFKVARYHVLYVGKQRGLPSLYSAHLHGFIWEKLWILMKSVLRSTSKATKVVHKKIKLIFLRA